ncbi:MAG TPA: hypothetical protein PK110_07350 [Niabella sp.]|jgi:hypothetical protein|nr:hypothetical protein [Chitinophagaceae bacterium]HRN46872.1 hypothetical protein [Niabella sp.]HRO84621.1 hypothetical protein [Niabella sp.]
MAINKNHEFEELDGIKCSIVERNITHERAVFLKDLLVENGYTVVIIPAPPPKTAAKPAAKQPEAEASSPVADTPPPPALFVMGVTDLRFNPVNAIFGRQLKTPSGHIVTQSYWNQEESASHDEMPYYEHTKLMHPM